MTGSDADLEQKLAQAAVSIGQLVAAVSQMQQSHANSVKFASAITEAARLAQDGVIDPGSILEYATRKLSTTEVKLSAFDGLLSKQIGDVVGKAQTTQLDPLTALLRARRAR